MILDFLLSWLVVKLQKEKIGDVYWSLILTVFLITFVGSIAAFVLFEISPWLIALVLLLFGLFYFQILGKVILKKFESTINVRITFFVFSSLMMVLYAMLIPMFREHVAEPFVVSGVSMNPNYYTGDYLIVKKYDISYQVGDVVIYTPPDNLEKFYIGRIANVSGETTDSGISLRENEFYILGDNANESVDSRDFGPVSKELIYGDIWTKLYSAQ